MSKQSQKIKEMKPFTYSIKSNSQLALREKNEKFLKGKHPEKEFESIGEESTVQHIQESLIKRDKSAKILRDQGRREGSISKDELNKLESDLLHLRKQYLLMVDEKLKVEKENIACKTKIKILECKSEKDDEKIKTLEKRGKKFLVLEKKYEETSEKLKEISEKFKEIVEKVENDKSEKLNALNAYEDKINKLTKENLILKQELLYKDSFCEKLQTSLDELKLSYKGKYENKAVKTLSGIILSKDLNSQKFSKKAQDLSISELIESNRVLAEQNNDLNNFISLIKTLIDSQGKMSSLALTQGLSPDNEKTLKKLENLFKEIQDLHQTIETLEAKQDFFQSNTDILSFIQCQAAVIEDYLNEDLEISQINSSLFSI